MEVIVVYHDLITFNIFKVLLDSVDDFVQNCEKVELAHRLCSRVKFGENNLKNFHQVTKMFWAFLGVLEVEEEQVYCFVKVLHVMFKFPIQKSYQPIENLSKMLRQIECRKPIEEVDPFQN